MNRFLRTSFTRRKPPREVTRPETALAFRRGESTRRLLLRAHRPWPLPSEHFDHGPGIFSWALDGLTPFGFRWARACGRLHLG